MTRIHITDDTVTIKRSDLPTERPTPYPEQDLVNGVVSFELDGTEVFHNTKDQYEHWLPEQEDYILNAVSALIFSQEIEAQLNVTTAERLLADMDEILTGYGDDMKEIAELLIAKGWKK